MDLLKLKLKNTGKKVGAYTEFEVTNPDITITDIDTVLVKQQLNNEYIDILILYKNDIVQRNDFCQAKFVEVGLNKIDVIKATREATAWGLKESKDFVESFPRTVTAKELPKTTLKALVDGINKVGGSAVLCLGTNCDKCEFRFRCFTER